MPKQIIDSFDGTSFNPGWTRVHGTNHTMTISGGTLNFDISGTDNSAQSRIQGLVTAASGEDFIYEGEISDFQGTVGAAPEEYFTLLMAHNSDLSRYVYIQRMVQGAAGNVISAFYYNGTSEVQIGSNVSTTALPIKVRIQLTGTTVNCWYNTSGTWVSFGTTTVTASAYLCRISAQGNSIDTADACSCKWSYFKRHGSNPRLP